MTTTDNAKRCAYLPTNFKNYTPGYSKTVFIFALYSSESNEVSE